MIRTSEQHQRFIEPPNEFHKFVGMREYRTMSEVMKFKRNKQKNYRWYKAGIFTQNSVLKTKIKLG